MKDDKDIAVRDDEFRLAIHQTHNCEAEALECVVHVVIPRRNGAPWKGKVHVFGVTGHPNATRCYAWPESLGKTAIMVRSVLHSDRISSPEKAVRSVLRRVP
jgi:hypothetical protein